MAVNSGIRGKHVGTGSYPTKKRQIRFVTIQALQQTQFDVPYSNERRANFFQNMLCGFSIGLMILIPVSYATLSTIISFPIDGIRLQYCVNELSKVVTTVAVECTSIRNLTNRLYHKTAEKESWYTLKTAVGKNSNNNYVYKDFLSERENKIISELVMSSGDGIFRNRQYATFKIAGLVQEIIESLLRRLKQTFYNPQFVTIVHKDAVNLTCDGKDSVLLSTGEVTCVIIAGPHWLVYLS